MTVVEFGGVADVLAGDGLHALLEQGVGGAPRDHDAIAQGREGREPERVVLVHVEGARQTQVPAEGLLDGESSVAEEPLVLGLEDVGQFGLRQLGHRAVVDLGAAVTAVAGDEDASVREGGDGALAVVLAQGAVVAVGLDGEPVQFGAISQTVRGGGLARMEAGTGRQRGTVSTHESGLGRTDDLAAGEFLEGSQHGIVEEGAALDDDLVTQLGRIGKLDDLVQGVADHGVGQSGSDVGGGGPFLLGLLDRGVHEDGAAAAQVDGMLGHQAHVGEGLDVSVHPGGEGLEEGSTSRRAGLIDGDGVNDLVDDAQVLHVLAADVDDGGDSGKQVISSPVVGHRLDLTVLGAQGSLDEPLAVTGGTGTGDGRLCGHGVVEIGEDLHCCAHRVALVGGVMGGDDVEGLVKQYRLDRRRTGVDTEEEVAASIMQWQMGEFGLGVTLGELGQFLFIPEQWRHRLGDAVLGAGVTGTLSSLGEVDRLRGGRQGSPHGHVELGALRCDVLVDLALENSREGIS